MNWKSIDFQGITSLESPLIEALNQYLEEKESYLAHTIIDRMPISCMGTPQLPPDRHHPFKLTEAIEIFTKCHFQNTKQIQTGTLLREWKEAVISINKALWDYIEAIDSCITELFQQIDQIGLEKWHIRLSHVIGSIRELLNHKIEDLSWAIRRLEDLLRKLRSSFEENRLKQCCLAISSLWKPILDGFLLPHLKRDQEMLKSQYQKFHQRYDGFIQLQDRAEVYLNKLSDYPLFRSLDQETQRHFAKIYQLLKLWELNRSAKTLPTKEFILALRHAASVDKATLLFKEYYRALRSSLFAKSLSIKQLKKQIEKEGTEPSELEETLSEQNEENLVDQLKIEQAEVHLLGSTAAHYREFLLRADPDPYVRSRLGFSDWIVGPEPLQTKPLLNLGYDIESLGSLYNKMIHTLSKNSEKTSDRSSLLDGKIQEILHEMSHPLSSHRLMRRNAENILDKLEQIDELSSRDPHIIEYFGQLLSQLMRVDWRYHVLFGFPNFHQIYSVHHELIKPSRNRHHSIRLHKFQKLIQQILEWVKAQKTEVHSHEIELDMNDIKGYLQDFLGYIQRNLNDSIISREKAFLFRREMLNELLEYRYLFGNFFYRLRQNESDGSLIRRQFLFVDQYFETIEQKLNEIAEREWPEGEAPRKEEGNEEDSSEEKEE